MTCPSVDGSGLAVIDIVGPIGTSRFSSCDALASVVIGNSVTSIGDYAFEYCSNLESVTIGSSVSFISGTAFRSCSSLTTFAVTSGNKYFAEDAGVLLSHDMKELDRYPCGRSEVEYKIPAFITSIASDAFLGCSKLTSVTLSSSVASVGRNCFKGCSELQTIMVEAGNKHFTSVDGVLFSADGKTLFSYPRGKTSPQSVSYTVPEGVTSIADYAFQLSGLTSVTLPTSLISIGAATFERAGLRSVTFPTSLVSIGAGAFAACGLRLESLVIGDSVTSIGSTAFSDCYYITSVTLGKSVAHIATDAFLYSSSIESFSVVPENKNFVSVGGVLFTYDMKQIIAFPRTKTGSYTIPDGVRSIPSSVFYSSQLTSVIIPASVTYIGDSAFYSCNLIEVEMGSSVTYIGANAFSGCRFTSITIPASVTSIGNAAFASRYLHTIEVDPGNRDFVVRDGMLCSKDMSRVLKGLISQPTDLVIPDSVTVIDDDAFDSCSYLKSVVISDSVSTISNGAFAYCSQLTSVVIGISVKWFGTGVFESCSSLSKVIYKGVKSPESTGSMYSIWLSTLVTSITVPSNYQGDTCCGKEIHKEDLIFDNDNDKSVLIRVSPSFAGIDGKYIIPSTVREIDSYAFSGCTQITSVEIPSTVTSIGDAPFASCTALTTIDLKSDSFVLEDDVLFTAGKERLVQCLCGKTGVCDVPSSVTSIGGGAFQGCDKLTSINIPSTVTSVGVGAFRGCKQLSSLSLPSVPAIGKSAFQDCIELSSITIPTSVKVIGESAFQGCTKLASVAIQSSVTSIGAMAFQGCSKLSSIPVPSSITRIEESTFQDCTGLISITIPSSIQYIGESAFMGCTELVSVTIPSSVLDIGNGAFQGCTKLSEVIYEGTVEPSCSSLFRGTAVSFVHTVPEYDGDEFCGIAAGKKSDPTATESPDDGLSDGAITGITVGCVVGVSLITLTVLFILKKRGTIDLVP